ncbi:MAG: NTP transferase domain-containing protein [Microlunatus sp.]
MPSAETNRGIEGLAVVVLAGGESLRFGSDKLVARLDDRTLLDHALDGIPLDTPIAVIGPERPLPRKVVFLREDPPGGGPAAGLIAGLRWALDLRAMVIATLPGDAPAGGRAAVQLVDALAGPDTATKVDAVVAVDADGREQVLQLAMSPHIARALIELTGAGAGHGESVRRLLHRLAPPPRRVELPEHLTADIDSTAQLSDFRNQNRA